MHIVNLYIVHSIAFEKAMVVNVLSLMMCTIPIHSFVLA
uniref:Uncharacterized protein n=1 Tax=Anguilla anguilla TaxID=7936 RepID=A0A0E9R447_ANGAN